MQAAFVYALTMFALLWGVSFSYGASSPPPVMQQVSLLPPDAQPSLPPPPPKAEPEPEPKPLPKPKPKPAPKPKADADIALKQKQKEEEEKRRKEREEKERKKAEAKKKKEEAERKRREERKRKEEERKRKREEERRKREQAEKRLREQQQRERDAARLAALNLELGKERRAVESGIQRRIEQKHSHPTSVPKDADIEVIYVFRLVPDGTGRAILEGLPVIEQSSGNDEYDESVYRAILQARVFPFPRSPELAQEFVNITLRMSPLDR